MIALQFVLGGKAYYPGAAFTFLLAAGCVPLERRLAARTPRARRARQPRLAGPGHARGPGRARPCWPARCWPRRWRCPSCRPARCTPCRCRRSTTTSARRSPGRSWWRWSPGSTTPCRPRSGGRPRSWPATTARRERSTATVPRDGLPQVYSGANNFWLWGPPPAADSAAIAVNVDLALLRREFAHVRQVATFWNGLGVRRRRAGSAGLHRHRPEVFLDAGLARLP